MRKKIAMSLVLIGLLAAVMAGGTFAYFTSTAANTGNTFSAGTIALSTDKGATAFLNFENPLLKPGDNGTGTLTLSNTGSLPATLTFTTAVTTNTPGHNGGSLGDDLYFTITNGAGTTVYTGTLTALAALTTPTALPQIAPGGTQTFTVDWVFKDNGTPGSDTTGDNLYQGSTCVAGFTFAAAQVGHI